jgi:hypothetical protein
LLRGFLVVKPTVIPPCSILVGLPYLDMASYLPPFQPQPYPSNEHLGFIEFRHPGYARPHNLLLRIARVDRSAPTEPLGVHHGTALVALQIIADNAFETGRFTLDKDGQEEVRIPLDAILTVSTLLFCRWRRSKYVPIWLYFYFPEIFDTLFLCLGQYPVVPSFRDWAFPHGRVPRAWTWAAAASPKLLRAITKSSIALERAHLVPSEHDEWYSLNEMEQYGGDIDDPANIIILSPHIHRYFDNRSVVSVPKASRIDDIEIRSESRGSSQYVLHLMSDSVRELFPNFQNTLVQDARESSRPYLFARFAWTVLFSAKFFVTRGANRTVTRLYYTPEPGEAQYKSETLTGPELQMLYGEHVPEHVARETTPTESEEEYLA